jgi:8-oxo-dGTP pyrophosphatase MutT (NUDIX family)
MQNERDDEGDYYLVDSESVRSSLTPRLIILDGNGNFPLVRYKDTDWLGLPGGKAKKNEVEEGANFLSSGAFPTLIRELREECDIDISDYINGAACLGLAEIAVVDSVNRQVNFTFTPIFICRTSEIGAVSEITQVVNLREHLPGPLFPDAQIAIKFLKEGSRSKKGPIQPEWLNDRQVYYYEMLPQIRLLTAPPDWML